MTIVSRDDERTDELICDYCHPSNSDPVVFLISKWDTTQGEYYISYILCGPHKEELYEETK